MAFNLEAETRKAMARPLGSARLAGAARPALPTPDEMARYGDGYRRYSIRDEPYPEGLLAEGEHQDAVAEQVGCHEYDAGCGELPVGYDPTWWGTEGERL
jgi:hypothetical protein